MQFTAALRAALLLAAVVVHGRPLGSLGTPVPTLSDERLVLQTTLGDIELAFYPDVAPETVAHILELGRLGCYNTNHFFRVDKGFVAQARALADMPARTHEPLRPCRLTLRLLQVADVVGGRSAPMTTLQVRDVALAACCCVCKCACQRTFPVAKCSRLHAQQREGSKTVPGEFSDVKHTRGVISMGRRADAVLPVLSCRCACAHSPPRARRYDDPDSGTSSFSILLGSAPHLDGKARGEPGRRRRRRHFAYALLLTLLLARSMPPLTTAVHCVWSHDERRRCADRYGSGASHYVRCCALLP